MEIEKKQGKELVVKEQYNDYFTIVTEKKEEGSVSFPVMGQYKMTRKKFKDAKEVKEYLDEKPYEVIMSAICIAVHEMEKNIIKEKI